MNDLDYPECRVYWGSHGCLLARGHRGSHLCTCCTCKNHPDPDSGCVAAPPYYGSQTRFYGEDAPAPILNLVSEALHIPQLVEWLARHLSRIR